VGQDYGIDVDIVLSWPISKLYRYMAFYITESDKFKEDNKKDKVLSFEEICQLMEKDGLL
jgi:hypothetical protein